MSRLKTLLKTPVLHALATLGPRHWPLPRPRLLILTYHRILPRSDSRYGLEQPGMVVTPETFERQLGWLRDDGFQFIRLSDWAAGRHAAHTGKLCAITFDDGWHDNYEFAFPILRRLAIPFHIYVVLNQLGGAGDYWPGRVARILAGCIGQRVELAGFSEAAWLVELLPQPQLPAQCSREFIDAVIIACKRHADAWIYERLDALEAVLPATLPGMSQRALLNDQELAEMLASGLLEVGCHTANHTRLLDTLSPPVLEQEIVASRAGLERSLHSTVTSFCYPNGDYSDAALSLVRQHYNNAVTTRPGWNFARSDTHLLRRISMHEDATSTAPLFWAKMSGWL
jgi:peptidoglycan/xylan/chitin deacetylase (PgdA/CDA1 family)